jgi:hypothetical protein
MKFNIKERFDHFVNGDKDYPLLVGFLSGFYPLVFYYSNNFESINSIEHLIFFSFIFLIVPTIGTLLIYIVFNYFDKLKLYKRHFLFIISIELTAVFFSQVYFLTIKKKILLLLLIGVIFISVKVYRDYKKILIFIFLMAILPLFSTCSKIISNYTNSTTWQNQPDAILKTKFKIKPNIYYIQPDGYANEFNLKGSLYQYDNTEFDSWLKNKNFTLYDDFRSNYESTLYSNSSCFFMKHHLSNENSNFKYTRDYIVGKNPVLNIFKDNNYKTFFLTENPYLLINRPKIAYDYCNFKLKDLPYFDNFGTYKQDITSKIKLQIVNNTKTNNFFFIEKFSPGHIAVYKSASLGAQKERIAYIERLEEANKWLTDIVLFIEKNDPKAIVIIGADHGGFVGFDYTVQASKKMTDKKLLHSIFGAKLAIRWNNDSHCQYDLKLKTAVNLFRILFSYLSNDKKLLNSLQPDISYNLLDVNDPSKVYKAIE